MAFWVLLISILARLTSLPRAQKIATFTFRAGPSKNSLAKLGQTIDSLLGMELFVFRRSCWKRALVLQRYLALNGIDSRIRFGLRKESNGAVDGHAWLEHDGQPLLEEHAADYIVTFSLPREEFSPGPADSYQL
jgi:hypothetical protein